MTPLIQPKCPHELIIIIIFITTVSIISDPFCLSSLAGITSSGHLGGGDVIKFRYHLEKPPAGWLFSWISILQMYLRNFVR